MGRNSESLLVKKYCEEHQGELFDFGYLSSHHFKTMDYNNLRMIVSRLDKQNVIRKISNCIFIIGESDKSDEEIIIDHYLKDGFGMASGEYLLYKLSIIEDIATESHFLLDDEDYDYAGTNPAGIQIRDEKIVEDSWANLYVATIKYLYRGNKESVLSILSKRELFSSERLLISDSKDNLTRPSIIDEGLYVETNNNTERKIKILKVLLSNLQFEPDEVIIFIK